MRRERLDRLILLLTENAELFAEKLNQDFGNRPVPASLLSDVHNPGFVCTPAHRDLQRHAS